MCLKISGYLSLRLNGQKDCTAHYKLTSWTKLRERKCIKRINKTRVFEFVKPEIKAMSAESGTSEFVESLSTYLHY